MLKIKKIKPMFNNIVTTADKYDDDYRTCGIIDPSKSRGSFKEYQTVVAVGNMVKDIKPGDTVMIDPKRYAVKKHQAGSLKDGIITDNPVTGYNFNTVMINDVMHFIFVDADVMYVFEGEEVPDEPDTVVQVIKNEILPTT